MLPCPFLLRPVAPPRFCPLLSSSTPTPPSNWLPPTAVLRPPLARRRRPQRGTPRRRRGGGPLRGRKKRGADGGGGRRGLFSLPWGQNIAERKTEKEKKLTYSLCRLLLRRLHLSFRKWIKGFWKGERGRGKERGRKKDNICWWRRLASGSTSVSLHSRQHEVGDAEAGAVAAAGGGGRNHEGQVQGERRLPIYNVAAVAAEETVAVMVNNCEYFPTHLGGHAEAPRGCRDTAKHVERRYQVNSQCSREAKQFTKIDFSKSGTRPVSLSTSRLSSTPRRSFCLSSTSGGSTPSSASSTSYGWFRGTLSSTAARRSRSTSSPPLLRRRLFTTAPPPPAPPPGRAPPRTTASTSSSRRRRRRAASSRRPPPPSAAEAAGAEAKRSVSPSRLPPPPRPPLLGRAA